MKLKQINKIKEFGVFQDFGWNASIPPFSTFNAIYGWNYSGKTTLSRVLRSFETGIKHPDYGTSTFEIEDITGAKYTEANFPNKLPIRVFNSDFIEDNLKWSQGTDTIEPIILLGEDNIALQAELEAEKVTLVEQEGRKATWLAQKSAEEERLSYALTNKAKEIKTTLSIPVFTKVHFEPTVNSITAVVPLLTDAEIVVLLNTYRSGDKKPEQREIALSALDLKGISVSASKILTTTVTSKVIDRLKDNATLNEWVRTGKDIHAGKTDCEFCGNPLPKDLLESLGNHFSKDYDELITLIGREISTNSTKKITVTLPDPANFYTEFQAEYLTAKEDLEREINATNATIDDINTVLDAKKTNAFTRQELMPSDDNTSLFNAAVANFNEVIAKHNKKTADFDKEREEAKTRLIANYALELYTQERYPETKTAIAKLESEIIPGVASEIVNTKEKIIKIEEKLSEIVKGAEKVNEYLSQYFGKDDIKVVVTEENKFQLKRGDIIAKNLSEGEKTAIAFVYFITRLEDKDTTLADTVVYIDDPISSLDANHLFNTYSIIRDKLYLFDGTDTTGNKHKCHAGQFFISTHNFELLNLVKDWYKPMKDRDRAFHLIERISNTTQDESTIKKMPLELLSFKSEYTYLFFILYSFTQSPTTDFSQLYNLPNIVRRFIEAFCAFKFLETINLDGSIEKLIPDSVNCEKVRKFVHYYSHSLGTSRMMMFSDPTECKEVIGIVLDALKNLDETHYNALIAGIPTTPALATV